MCVHVYMSIQLFENTGFGEKSVLKTEKFRTSDLYKNFLQISEFSEVSRPAVGPTKTPVSWVAGGGSLSSRICRPDRESYHASPFSAKFKNNWTYTSTPPYAFIQDFVRETS